MSILVITIFILIQFIFQRTNLIPQLPASLISEPLELKSSENPMVVEDVVDDQNNNNNMKEISKGEPVIPDEPIQSQMEEDLVVHDEDKSLIHQSDQSSIVIDQLNVSQILQDGFIDEKKSESKETNEKPVELPKVNLQENKPDIKPEIEPEIGPEIGPESKPQIRLENELEIGEKAKLASKSKEFTIILWTDFFQTKDYIQNWQSNCDYTNCQFTSNRDSYHEADALMFHSADIKTSDLPTGTRNPQQRWIYLNHESPSHTVFQPVAALNGLINWTVTYRLDSDFSLSPVFLPLESVKPELSINHYRPGKVAWFVSNCKTPSNRESYVDELKKYIRVDIFGTCGNLTCLPKMSDQCYDTLSQKYYFYLSFENSLCPDYVTEKFFSILNYPIVPIVFGGADYSRIAPPNSYIDALSYDSPAKLADYLVHLMQTPEEYDVYFNWKRYHYQTYSHYGCKICSALNQPKQSTKTWDHLSEWWFEEAPCKRWMDGKLVPWKSP